MTINETFDPVDVLAFIAGYFDSPSDEWRNRFPDWSSRITYAHARFDREAGQSIRRPVDGQSHITDRADAINYWVFLPLIRRALAAAELKRRVVVVIEGGLVQTAIADGPVEVTVIDYDTDRHDPASEETYAIPQNEGCPPQEAYRSTFEAETDSGRIDAIKAAPLYFDYDAPVGELVTRWINCRVSKLWPERDQRVLWTATFVIDGCAFGICQPLPVTTIEAAGEMAQRCLNELWPGQVEKLDQSFIQGQRVPS